MIDNYLLYNKSKIDKTILEQTKKNKEVVYGAQSIKKQIGVVGRNTFDYDIMSKNAKRSSIETEKKLEAFEKGNQFFVKPAKHKGTFKIKYVGSDKKQNTDDDQEIADYTQVSKYPSIKKINGINYRTLTQESKAKRMAIKDKSYAFRKEKDTDDLNRIKLKKIIFD